MISCPRVFQTLSTKPCLLLCMGLQKHTLHAMQELYGEGQKLAGLPLLPMWELQ